jgi:hypothetical protein
VIGLKKREAIRDPIRSVPPNLCQQPEHDGSCRLVLLQVDQPLAEGPVLLAVDQQLGEGARLGVAPMGASQIWRLTDIAQYLGMTRQRVSKLAAAGRLPSPEGRGGAVR